MNGSRTATVQASADAARAGKQAIAARRQDGPVSVRGDDDVVRQSIAVLIADVAGYSALMEADEAETHTRLLRLWSDLIGPIIAEGGGVVIKNTGDGVLARFGTAPQAVSSAVKLQVRLLALAIRLPPEKRILLRVGVNHCQAIVESNDIFGEGVNVAARLMALAEPGDLVLTEATTKAARDELRGLTTFETGELYLKNMRRPVRATGVRIASVERRSAPRMLGVTDVRPSIAVLPFRTFSADRMEELCARSAADEITHALASVRELFVVSRGSTSRLTDEALDLRSVGRELGVRYLLGGTVRQLGDRLRVQTQLIDAESGQIVRSERHEGTSEDLLELDTQIAISATTSIAPHIQSWDLRRAMRKHPESLTAYDLVLQARQHLFRLNEQSSAQARSLLQQAIALDPSYGPAHSSLAYWYIFRVGEWVSSNPEQDAVEAARVAQTAIELDQEDALARAIYGHVQSFLFRDFETALQHFDRAVQDGPNCAEAWSMSSVTHGFLGNGETAVERAAYGLRLSPLDGHIYYKESSLAQAYYVNGDFEAAIAWSRNAQNHNPAAMFNDRLLAASLAAIGRTAEAKRVVHGLLRRVPDFSLSLYRQRCPFRGAALENWIDRLRLAGLPD